MAHQSLYAAVLAFANEDYEQAAALAQQAAANDPTHPLYPAAATYLARVAREGKANVYVSGEGFAAFIRGGGNIGLYAATSAALHAIYNEYTALGLLDIGVGDGLALLPALASSIKHIDLIEPSSAMLAKTCAALDTQHISYRAYPDSLQTLMAETAPAQPWQLAQATYSLHNLAPQDRATALRWLRQNVERLLVVEFDVPALFDQPHTAQCVDYVAERYKHGLAEYPDDETVIQGFLMPIMFGYFDKGATRSTYEQPISAWHTNLLEAGFRNVRQEQLYPYWWANAYLLDAK
jgi:hypothetical protein